MRNKEVIYLGGTGGVAKTATATSVANANPGTVATLNCTQELMTEVGARERKDLHRFSPQQKIEATTEALRKRIDETEARLIILDGHYAVETEPGEFETGCFPDQLNGTISKAIHVSADPSEIRAVRSIDEFSRKRGKDTDRIQRESEESIKEAMRIKNEAGVPLEEVQIQLKRLETRWNLGPVLASIADTAPWIKVPEEKTCDQADGLYPVFRSTSLDDLVVKGMRHILEHGETIEARSGKAQQAYNVTYHLEGSRDRVHSLRHPGSTKYLARELKAYFKGNLDVEGLAKASRFWKNIADENGKINSNYGHYAFREDVPSESGVSNQFEWAIKQLMKNPDSRKAIININQTKHKTTTKDFPCTLGIQFFIQDGHLNCTISSRSTDVFTGLPYDLGFFSFLNELMCQMLREKKYPDLKLGYTTMRTTFTQIYDKTRNRVLRLLDRVDNNPKPRKPIIMPPAEGTKTYADIMKSRNNSKVVSWINRMAKKQNTQDT
jgi:thymidylate synthase